MALKWLPKVQYGSGPTTFAFTLPQQVWTPSARPIGGSNLAMSGVPETYVIRRDQLCKIGLRFYEAEWTNVDAWLTFAQTGQSFFFWFEGADNATKYTVYLEDPKLGNGDVVPQRDSFKKIMVLPVTLRMTTSALFDIRPFT